MLKIKDNIDLKELVKFGYDVFDYDYVKNEQLECPYCRKHIKTKGKRVKVNWAIYIEDKKLVLRRIHSQWFVKLKRIKREYIADLIQAGLVEKVEG